MGSSGLVRAEPKTVTAGPTSFSASKPSTNSERMRRTRHGSAWWLSSSIALRSSSILSAGMARLGTTRRPALRPSGMPVVSGSREGRRRLGRFWRRGGLGAIVLCAGRFKSNREAGSFSLVFAAFLLGFRQGREVGCYHGWCGRLPLGFGQRGSGRALGRQAGVVRHLQHLVEASPQRGDLGLELMDAATMSHVLGEVVQAVHPVI